MSQPISFLKTVVLAGLFSAMMTAGPIWGLDGASVLRKDAILGFYLNLGRISSTILEKAKSLGAPENAVFKGLLTGLCLSAPGGIGSPEELVKKILDADGKRLFKPAGGLWFCFTAEMEPAMAIEGILKPGELVDALREAKLLSEPPVSVSSAAISFRITPPGGKGKPLPLEVRSDGVLFGGAAGESLPKGSTWDFLIKKAASPDTWFALEVDGPAVLQALSRKVTGNPEKACSANMRVLQASVEMYNMDKPKPMQQLDISGLVKEQYLKMAPVCPSGGTYGQSGDLSAGESMIRCSLHNTVENLKSGVLPAANANSELADPRLKGLQRARIIVDSTSVLMMVAIGDEANWALLKDQLNEQMNKGRETLANAVSDDPQRKAQIEMAKGLLEQLKVIDKKPWLGLSLSGMDQPRNALLAISGLGFLASMAIPNFQKARDTARGKACFANQRVILGAVEMYNMDHSEGLHAIADKDVREGGSLCSPSAGYVYLKTPITSPDPDCEYRSEGDLYKDGKIRCKGHGSVNDQ